MSEWIHCNKCNLRYRSSLQFYVSSCGHLHCKPCASKVNEKQCSVCSSPCDMLVLSNDMPYEMQCFFQPPSQSFDRTTQICMFQLNNAHSLIRNISCKYNTAKGEIIRTSKMVQDLRKENVRLRTLLAAFRGGAASNNTLPGISPIPAFNITPVINRENSGMSWNMQEHSGSSRQQHQSVQNSFTLATNTSLGSLAQDPALYSSIASSFEDASLGEDVRKATHHQHFGLRNIPR